MCILMILYVGMKLQVISNSSKLKYSFYVLVFSARFIINVREHNNYNMFEQETSFKITLCIFVILCVEMSEQMIQNLNKLTKEVPFSMHFYSFLCVIHLITARAHNNYNIKI
jgi:hypothetical protein